MHNDINHINIIVVFNNQPQGAVLATNPPSIEVKVFTQTTTFNKPAYNSEWVVSLRGANNLSNKF